jgi:hypothetical protein
LTTNTFLEIETLTTKNSEVLDVRILADKNFIGSLVQVLAEIKPVGGMACGINRFGPKVVWRLELHQHGSCHIHKSPVLPLSNSILLRGICSGILMFDPRITKKLI